jgi:hypothetical protein
MNRKKCRMFNDEDFLNINILKHDFMKKGYAFSLVLIFILSGINRIHAQTDQSDLKQMELLKQFTGTWENKTNKDTLYTAEFKTYGNDGLEFTLKSVTQGKVWLEMRQLWGYDKKSDKIVIGGFMKDSPNFMLQAGWFTANNRFEQVPYEFATNPEKAGFIVIFDLKSPDLVVRTEMVNGKALLAENFTRVKN